MNTIEILEAARKRIETPEQWAQAIFERNGRVCAGGAIKMAIHGNTSGVGPLVCECYRALEQDIPSRRRWLSAFNDTHTHAEVLDLFDRTIARLRQQQGAGTVKKKRADATLLKLRRILNDEARAYRRFQKRAMSAELHHEWRRALYVIETIRQRITEAE